MPGLSEGQVDAARSAATRRKVSIALQVVLMLEKVEYRPKPAVVAGRHEAEDGKPGESGKSRRWGAGD
jgi:hypothetical protein